MTRLWATAGAAGAVLALALPATSSASCIGPLTTKQYVRQADVVFVGVALEGPTPTGIQRFRVDRYLKGDGPDTAAVATGVVEGPDGSSTTSVSINAKAGEPWQIYARKNPKNDVLATTECDGSGKLGFTPVGPGPPTADLPAAAAAPDEDRTKAVLLATGLGVLALFAVTFLIRRRLRRTVTN